MAKKIKSFTVNEDTYNRLVSMFKKYQAETSISGYLNNKLKGLLVYFEDMEKGIKEMNYSIPMQFVIDDTVRGSANPHHLSSEPEQTPGISELEQTLIYTQEDYEADKEGIPREFYKWLKFDNLTLSNDKKFLIEKNTGVKFISDGMGHLMETRKIDNEKIKRNK
jgi:hypothetical protein